MADNKVKIDVKVDDKGSTKKVALNSKKAGEALDQVGRSAQTADRNLKGAAQASANGTKNFAKMAQGIGGVLVPAYATLAANIFAVTAAFSAFQKAAQIQQLESSLVRLGHVGGQNLRGLADSLKDITDNAIDTEAALRATAQGVTQGFSGSQLKGLTTIAKGASIALGRDMADAMDRLIRGTAKLEPEILDELGIIVRLDDATKDYAQSIGKTASQLTAYEKQQAFANAVLEQGAKKFNKIAQSAESNPYDKLGAAFGDLKKSFFELFSVLTPVIELLAASPVGLLGAIGLLASTIVKQLTPALSEMAETSREQLEVLQAKAAEAAEAVQSKFSIAAKNMPEFDIAPAAFKELQKTMKQGAADASTYKKAIKSLNGSIGGHQAALNKLEKAKEGQRGAELKATKMAISLKQQEIAQLELLKQETLALQQIQQGGIATGGTKSQVNKAQRALVASNMGAIEAETLFGMQGAGVLEQFTLAKEGVAKLSAESKNATGFIGNLASKFRLAGGAAKLFGAALLNAIPIIGQILFFGGMLYEFLDSFIQFPWEKSKIEEAADDIASSLANVQKASLELRLELMQTTDESERLFLTLKNRVGIVDQLATSFLDLGRQQAELNSNKIKEYVKSIRELSRQGSIADYFSREFTEMGLDTEAIKRLREQNKEINTFTRAKEKQLILEEKIAKTINDSTVSAEAALTVAIAAREQASGALGKDSEQYRILDATVSELIGKIARGDNITQEYLTNIGKKLKSTEEGIARLVGAFEGLGQSVSSFNLELTKLAAKEDTPFTNLKNSADALLGTFSTIAKEAKGLGAVDLYKAIEEQGGKGALVQAEGLKNTEAFKTRKSQLQSDPYAKAIMSPAQIEALALEAAQKELTDAIKQADDEYRNQKATLDGIKAEISEISDFAKTNVIFAEEEFALQRKLIDTQTNRNAKIIEFLKDFENIPGVAEYINKLQNENNALGEERKLINQDNLGIMQAQEAEAKRFFDLEQKILGVKRQSFELDQQQQALKDQDKLRELKKNPFFDILDQGRTALDQEIKRLEAQIQFEKDNAATINAAKTALIEAEYALLDAQLRAEMEKLRIRSTDMSEGTTEAGRAAAAASASRLEGIIGTESGGGTLGQAKTTAIDNVAKETEANVDSLQGKLNSLKDSKADLEFINKFTDGIANSLESNMSSALGSLIDGTKSAKQAFSDMAKSILADIAAMIAKQLIFNALKAATGGFFGFADGGTAEGGFQAFAKGGYAPGGFRAFATGGIVNKPTLGLVGEGKMNEAIVPLPDGKSIPVQMTGSGAQQNNVTVNVSVDNNGRASSNTMSDSKDAQNLGNMIAQAVQRELQNQKRSGGILNPYGAS